MHKKTKYNHTTVLFVSPETKSNKMAKQCLLENAWDHTNEQQSHAAMCLDHTQTSQAVVCQSLVYKDLQGNTGT